MFSRRLTALVIGVILIVGCGRKGPPQPPPSKIPAPADDLSIQQRGEEILLQMTYPNVTLGGLPIDEVEAIEIYQLSRIIGGLGEMEEEDPVEEADEDAEVEPEAEEEAETGLFALPAAVTDTVIEESKESLVSVSGKDFAALADLAWSLKGSELDAAVLGDKLVFRIPLESPAERTEEEILIFGARTLAKGRQPSGFSNLVKLLPRTPPGPPADFTVEATPLGVQLDWEPGGDEVGFRVYRRQAKVREYGDPLATISKETLGYLDRTAEFGQRYIYTVTSLGLRNPIIESAIATEHEVDYRDRFPPNPPRELVALAEPGRVRLLWEASTSEDTQGYWIYRQDPGAGFHAINSELVLGSEYLDSEVASGSTYRYYILAVDSRDNQSEASEEIEVRVP